MSNKSVTFLFVGRSSLHLCTYGRYVTVPAANGERQSVITVQSVKV